MGRIFLTFLLTLIPLHVYAEEIQPCSTWSSGENAETTCNAQAGCYWESSESECKACSAGSLNTPAHYGPGCNINNVCDSDFPYGYQHTINGSTGARGARTKYECYREVSCTKSNGTDTESNCREYYRDGTNNVTQYPTYDSSANIYYKGTSDQHWVSCDENVGANDSPDETEDYHMESNNSVCYANTLPCRLFKPYFSNNLSTPLEECEFPEGETVPYSNGLWQPHSHCISCTLSNIEAKTSNGTYICHAYSATYNKDSAHPHTGDPSKNNVKLYFQYYPSTWQCNACKVGYVGFVSDFANQTNRKGCLPVARGYYSDGCSSGSCYGSDSWSYVGEYQITDGIQCETYNTPGQSGIYNTIKTFCHPCYAGMTTDSSGATGPSACHYTNNTQFCDAYGCVSMEQLLGATQTLSQDDWTWYMQQ